MDTGAEGGEQRVEKHVQALQALFAVRQTCARRRAELGERH